MNDLKFAIRQLLKNPVMNEEGRRQNEEFCRFHPFRTLLSSFRIL